jgi:hypothetical protein
MSRIEIDAYAFRYRAMSRLQERFEQIDTSEKVSPEVELMRLRGVLADARLMVRWQERIEEMGNE